ncbi:cyclic GMP-AMP synthase [Periophthalmus magnuspinnatus]|uniref:cyclic GMP-AMP synthase n=1 Tax=Periophthalmus magnuspinnatus TaxID=409849 RepID=UPI00145A995A|nr:cyclic GMP-AMP synthase [Periophthalmus magnuspinnatus]
MSGRRKPRTAKSPEAKRSTGTRTNTEEKQTKTFEEQAANFNPPASGARPKKCGAPAKVKLDEEIKKDPKKTTASGARPKKCGAPAKVKLDEEIKKDPKKTTTATTAQTKPNVNCTASDANPETCGTKTKSPVDEKDNIISTIYKDKCAAEQPESTLKGKKGMTQLQMKQLSHDDSKKADDVKKTELRTTLNATLENLKIRMKEKSKASEVINKLEKVILKHLRSETIWFRQVEEPLHTGSYYENLKISNPDEFDIMFPIPVQRIDIQPFTEDGAFYVVSLKRGYNPLKRFQEDGKPLPASEILQDFRQEVIESIKDFPGVSIDRKKRGCPAVTLNIKVESRDISLDIVLCLVVQSSWPDFTSDGLKIEAWLGRKIKKDYKFKPYYLVSKYEGNGNDERDGILAKDCWRISFSHVEKEILKNHGSVKTCCEKDGTHCCRKDCLKLLKHLLSLLKEQDKSFAKFCSYHVKTTFLHACCSRTNDSQWAAADLTQCFEQLLIDFEKHLESRQLNNFFIPAQNLLSGCSQKSCKSLALRIKKEREEGFPIFKC